MTAARIVVGVPVHNGAAHLAEALDSLLAQSVPVRVVAVDDASTDASSEILAGYGDAVVHERSASRLGLVEAWRRSCALALEAEPSASFFAWGSDHDVWDPRWAERLAAALDGEPRAAMAHSLVVAIDENGTAGSPRAPVPDTIGLADPRDRMRRANRTMRAGDMVYGLYRLEALRRCGPFPRTLLPDRLFLARLALEGGFVQVPEILWRRRYRRDVAFSLDRQRSVLFGTEPAPAAGRPWWIGHPRWLLGSLPPGRGRAWTVLCYLESAAAGIRAQRAASRRRARSRRRKALRRRVATYRARLARRAGRGR